jgi:hypothetical protein
MYHPFFLGYHMARGELSGRSRNGDREMHTMTLIEERDGTQEWFCPACGRHLLVSWNPYFKKTVLLEGDTSVKHTGLKKELLTGEKEKPLALLPGAGKDPIEDPRLLPWLTWMEESGFDNLWEAGAR